MSEPLRFPGTADGLGRFKPDEPEVRANELRKLQGKRLVETIVRERSTRSIEQNKLLWGGVYSEAVAEGVELVELASGLPVFQTSEDVHGFAKLMLLRRPVMTNRGELNLLGTTTTLSTDEFSTYIEMLCAKLANLGIYIPPAGSRA